MSNQADNLRVKIADLEDEIKAIKEEGEEYYGEYSDKVVRLEELKEKLEQIEGK